MHLIDRGQEPQQNQEIGPPTGAQTMNDKALLTGMDGTRLRMIKGHSVSLKLHACLLDKCILRLESAPPTL